MSIYRGAGGSGDAVNDSSSEASLVAQLVVEAQADADAAQASATAAAGSASTASTQATNAANSATAASTSASNASTSATNAASSASAASTSASNASTSATNASNSATSASASASTATTQAGIATTQATNASTSATNASNSATAAAASATTASAASAAALTALDNFDDRYLGQKSSNPTLDNDGNALITGALYFNTVSNSMKVYTGTIWVDAYADGNTFLAKANNLSDLANASTARTNLGVAIGTNVQAYDAELASIAALAPTADNFIVGNGTTWILETPAQARTSLGATTVGSNLVTLTNPSAITFPRFNADNTVSTLDAATFRTAIGAGTSSTTGTVTSVTGTSPVASSGGNTPAISLAANYGDTQNPYASKTANFVLAAPNGSAGAPTFRAVVAADIPTLNQNTTGTASNVTGTVAIANGGTGATTRQNAMDALAGAVTSGQYLRGNGTDVVMSAIQAADVPTLNQNTTGSAATLTTGRTIAITGDLAYTSPSFNGSANVTAAGTLATVNSNVGSFGSSSSIPVITVNGKGLVTGVTTATVAGGQYFGTAASKAIAYNEDSIAENITTTSGKNCLSVGPITIASGFSVTIASNQRWLIL